MNHERLGELYLLLEEEFKKTPVNHRRIGEIYHYLAKEFSEPEQSTGRFWDRIIAMIPENWKTHVTAVIGALVALNTQFHWVNQDTQNALLALAISLGFWAVNSTQTLNLKKLKTQIHSLSLRR